MKLKYYLRGLGIGIIVMTVIMIVVVNTQSPMSDEEIKIRAAELGMVENTVLAPKTSESGPVTVEESTEEVEPESETVVPESTEIASETQDESGTEPEDNPADADKSNEEVSEEDGQASEENADAGEDTDDDESDVEEEFVILSIRSGEGSGIAAGKAHELGLVPDAAEFDKFLMANGYDKKIKVGDYEIPLSATPDEIGRIICGMN